MALGESKGSVKGYPDLGGVRVFKLRADGSFSGQPDAELWGETRRPGSRMSEGALNASKSSRRLIVGAREGGGAGLDHGSVYVLDLGSIF